MDKQDPNSEVGTYDGGESYISTRQVLGCWPQYRKLQLYRNLEKFAMTLSEGYLVVFNY